jgi:aldose 1-epimerase
VAGGRFSLDGTGHQLAPNAGIHHVHGGPDGFDRAVWTAEPSITADAAQVRLLLVSPDGDQGYPGQLTADTTYRLTDDGSLVMTYRAVTTAPTIVGLTNHAFWNLAGDGLIDGHGLALNAAHWVPADAEFIPLSGPPHSVTGSAMDYRTPISLAGRVIDAFFVLEDPNWAADLHHPASGRRMRITTDSPGIGVYTGDFYSRPRAGVCLETGPFPDAPNRPDFPSVRLNPDAEYVTRTTHHFSVD